MHLNYENEDELNWSSKIYIKIDKIHIHVEVFNPLREWSLILVLVNTFTAFYSAPMWGFEPPWSQVIWQNRIGCYRTGT